MFPPKFIIPVPLYLFFWFGLFMVPASSADTALDRKVEAFIKSLRHKGAIRSDERTAWTVYDLKTNKKLVSINEDLPLQAASMIKPFVALAFFHLVKEKKMIYGDVSRHHMELMIQKSNNEATNWVMRQVGGPAAVQEILKAHYPQICVNTKIVEYIPAGGSTYRNLASAHDYSQFLRALWADQLPSASEIRRIMALPGTNRIFTKVQAIPEGTLVFNKTGSTAMCCGDMGILWTQGRNGERFAYILVGIIQSDRRNNENYTTWISSRANVIRQVSGLVYTEMAKIHG